MVGAFNSVKIGVLGSVEKYASIHELGTRKFPKRSFLKASLINNKEYEKDLSILLNKTNINKPDEFKRLPDLIGLQAVGVVQQFIADNKVTPKTKSKRGRKTTLIDKGVLRRSINYVTN